MKNRPGFQKGNKMAYLRKKISHPQTSETRKLISKNNARYRKGKKRDIETVKKVSQSMKGKTVGEKNGTWMGDKVGYHALHGWVSRTLGKPTKCEFCGRDGLTGRYIQWANKSRKYLRRLDDWLRLCVKCHKKYDKK